MDGRDGEEDACAAAKYVESVSRRRFTGDGTLRALSCMPGLITGVGSSVMASASRCPDDGRNRSRHGVGVTGNGCTNRARCGVGGESFRMQGADALLVGVGGGRFLGVGDRSGMSTTAVDRDRHNARSESFSGDNGVTEGAYPSD